MKFALTLLITAWGAAAHAQPVYQCKDSFGNDAFQGRPCAESLQVADNADYAGSMTDARTRPASYDAPRRRSNDWNWQMRKQWRHYAKYETRAVTQRVENFLKPFNDQRQAQYAENRQRCETTVQIAALCGKNTEYTCGEKGFVPKPAADISAPRRLGKIQAYERERCLLHASKGKV